MSRHRQPEPEQAWEDLEDRPSKTELKKAMQRLQDLGQQLADLSPAQIKKLPVNEYLIDTLLELKDITAHEARRRQFQLVGKLLRSENEGVIIAALSGRQSSRKQAQLSRWIERLIEQGDPAVNEFVRLYGSAERHTLRQHVLRVQRSVAQQDPETEQVALRQNLVNYIQQVALLSE